MTVNEKTYREFVSEVLEIGTDAIRRNYAGVIPGQKVDKDTKQKIRDWDSAGKPISKIADELGLSKTTVNDILNDKAVET